MHTIPVAFISRSDVFLYDTFEVVDMNSEAETQNYVQAKHLEQNNILAYCVL